MLRGAFYVCSLLLLVSAVLAWQGRVDRDVHYAYARELRRASELDAQLDEQIAASAMGFVTHFDDLVRTWDQITEVDERLTHIPPWVRGEDLALLKARLAALRAAHEEEEKRLDRFKTNQAVLRTARRSLAFSLEKLTPDQARQLRQNLLVYELAPTPPRIDAARCTLGGEHAPCKGTAPPVTRDGTPEEAVYTHAEVVLARQPVVDDLVRRILRGEGPGLVDEAMQTYASAHATAERGAWVRERIFQVLGLMTVVLGATLIVSRIQNDAEALRDNAAREVQLKGRFVSMTSHQFRTPLSRILSSAELLQHYGETFDADKRAKHLNRIIDAAREMKDTMEHLLLIGKAEAGRLEARGAPAVLPEIVEPVVSAVEGQAGRKAEVSLELPDEPRIVDKNLLRHILTNPLTNAFKYSEPDTKVQLRVQADETGVHVVVRDRGIGIPEADRERLFEPFHRCANVGERPGTGLGLAMVLAAVQAHGGTVHITSRPGEGTEFRVWIPYLEEPPS